MSHFQATAEAYFICLEAELAKTQKQIQSNRRSSSDSGWRVM